MFQRCPSNRCTPIHYIHVNWVKLTVNTLGLSASTFLDYTPTENWELYSNQREFIGNSLDTCRTKVGCNFGFKKTIFGIVKKHLEHRNSSIRLPNVSTKQKAFFLSHQIGKSWSFNVNSLFYALKDTWHHLDHLLSRNYAARLRKPFLRNGQKMQRKLVT